MTMNDPIADMLSRIRNAQRARHDVVSIPASKLKGAVLEVLQSEGYVADVKSAGEGKDKVFNVTLKYVDEQPVISEIKRVSRPGLRVYSGTKDIPSVRDGLGISIVSTSRGMMTDAQARDQKLGGEVLCRVF